MHSLGFAMRVKDVIDLLQLKFTALTYSLLNYWTLIILTIASTRNRKIAITQDSVNFYESIQALNIQNEYLVRYQEIPTGDIYVQLKVICL